MPEQTTEQETQAPTSNVKAKVAQAGQVIRRYRKPYFVGLDGIVRTSHEDYMAVVGRHGWGNSE